MQHVRGYRRLLAMVMGFMIFASTVTPMLTPVAHANVDPIIDEGYSWTVINGEEDFNNPYGMTMDASGNLYVVDGNNDKIKTFSMGHWTTKEVAIRLLNPRAVAIDRNGNMYVVDTFNNLIKKFSNNVWTDITNGEGFSGPFGIAVDSHGTVYVADTFNSKIKKLVNDVWVDITYNGGFQYPESLIVDENGTVYVADTHHNTIKKLVQESWTEVTGGELQEPRGVAVSSTGELYVTDSGNNKVKKWSNGVWTDLTGSGSFRYPTGIAVDPAGTVYVSDSENNKVKRLTATNNASMPSIGIQPAGATVTAGTANLSLNVTAAVYDSGTLSYQWYSNATNSASGWTEIPGATQSSYTAPTTAPGTTYYYVVVTNTNPHVTGIQTVKAASSVAAVAVSAEPVQTQGWTDITNSGGFTGLGGLVIDDNGILHVVDAGNNTVKKLLDNVWTQMSGLEGNEGRFNDIAMDTNGNLYVLDANGPSITMLSGGTWTSLDPSGLIRPSDVAVDKNGNVYVTDNFTSLKMLVEDRWVDIASTAGFSKPTAVTVDSEGNLYVADNDRIKKQSGGIWTDVTGSTPFIFAIMLSADDNGNIYAADTINGIVRKLSGGIWTDLSSPGEFMMPAGIAADKSGNVYVSDAMAKKIKKLTVASTVVNAATPSITSQPEGAAVNVGDTRPTLSVTADVTDGGTLSYQWYSNTENSTSGSTAIAGAIGSSYEPLTTTAGTTYYYVVVKNTNTGVTGAQTAVKTSDIAAVSVNSPVPAASPTILNHPYGDTVYAGDIVTLGVTATKSDAGTLSFQWYSNTVESMENATLIEDATADFYQPAADTAGVMYYYVAVKNTLGSQSATTFSNIAMVTIKAAPVTGDWIDITGYRPVNGPIDVAASNDGTLYVADAYQLKRRVADGGWQAITPPVGQITGITTDSNGALYLIMKGSSMVLKYSEGGWGAINAEGLSDPVDVAVDNQGNIYAADTEFRRIMKLVGDQWENVTNSYINAAGLAVGPDGTIYVTDHNNRVKKLSGSSWVDITGEAVFLNPKGIGVDSQGNIYVADSGNSVVRKLSGNEWTDVSIKDEFFIPYGMFVGGNGEVYVCDIDAGLIKKLVAPALAPSIMTQPIGATVKVGDTGPVLSVTATSNDDGQLSYQWYRSDTASTSGAFKIGGATSSSYTISTENESDRYYYVVVTNSKNGPSGNTTAEVISAFVKVTVEEVVNAAEPTIMTQPVGSTVKVGDADPVLSVTSTSNDDGQLSYQWYRSDTASTSGAFMIEGATSSSYTISTENESDRYYYVVVTNTQNAANGNKTAEVISAFVKVTVEEVVNATEPTIMTQPVGVTVNAGDSPVLSVTAQATDGGILSYQWYSSSTANTDGGTKIEGATESTFAVPTDTAGIFYYYVIVTSTNPAAGEPTTATSRVAKVIIELPAYTVTYHVQDGKNFHVGISHGSKVPKMKDPERTGYTFGGWYKDAAGTVAWNFDTDLVTGDVTLYAKWTENSSSGDGDGGSDDNTDNGSGVASGNQPGGAPVPATDAVIVLVNGREEKIGKSASSTEGDRTVTTITVNPQQLEDKLQAEGQGAVVTIPVSAKSDVIVGELNGQMVKNMEDKQAVLVVQTGKASYTIPSVQVDIGSIAKQLGSTAALEEIKVKVRIAEPEAAMVKVGEAAAGQNGLTLVAPPVYFTVEASYEGQTVEVTRFSAYVERTIALPEGIDPNKITTGIVTEADGSVRHVPTKVTVIGGKYYAQINSLSNSMYSVIWHPLTFKDVEQHWAQQDVNDMGSRLVVNGVGDGLFNPDAAITRAEFAAIVMRGLGLKPVGGSAVFTDVQASDWYYTAVQSTSGYKLIDGFEDGTFRPEEKITREQAMQIIARAMAVTKLQGKLPAKEISEVLKPFADAAAASDWAKAGITASIQAGLVTGRSADELAPQASITRAEVAAIVKRLLKESGLI
jgi:uncharacterized repeat protein (TIGR02543 family)